MNNLLHNKTLSAGLRQDTQEQSKPCLNKRTIKLGIILCALVCVLLISIAVSTTFGSSALKIQTITSIIINKLIYKLKDDLTQTMIKAVLESIEVRNKELVATLNVI